MISILRSINQQYFANTFDLACGFSHGTTGFTYPAYDVEALATYLQKCLDMPPKEYKTLSTATLKKAQLFEPEKILFQYEEKITAP